MPISVDAHVCRLSQDEFGKIAFDVMGHAFDIHRELGRFFDEAIYHAELAHRCPDARSKATITIAFEDFRKQYCIDLLVGGGAVFELKTVEVFHDRHRSQLLNYLLLLDLGHGKLVNFRTAEVRHEFVNTTLTRSDRTTFSIDHTRWQPCDSSSAGLKQRLIAFLNDVGTGLDLELYQDAVMYWLGGPTCAFRAVEVKSGGQPIGKQDLLCTPDGVGIKLTAIKPNAQRAFEEHYRRFLRHTALEALHWINITRQTVTFKTLLPPKSTG